MFQRKNQPTTVDAITKFEKSRGFRLPDDYRDFLLTQNGGYTDNTKCFAELDEASSFLVQEFLGLTDNAETSIATDRFTNFSDFVHSRLLQIAYTPTGDVFFMDLRDGSAGRIYIRANHIRSDESALIDDAGFVDEDDYEEATLLYPVAANFSDFLEMLGSAPI